jgi:hypothetical protein
MAALWPACPGYPRRVGGVNRPPAARDGACGGVFRAKKKSDHSFTKNRIRAISFPVAESDLHDLRRAAARQKERTGKSPLRRFAHNPKRELRQGGKFFTPNGRNPLKNQESKK